MPLIIVEEVPPDCTECEHYSEYAGCRHPENGGGVLVSDDFNAVPPSDCPIRRGWPRFYKEVPVHFPEDFVPRMSR